MKRYISVKMSMPEHELNTLRLFLENSGELYATRAYHDLDFSDTFIRKDGDRCKITGEFPEQDDIDKFLFTLSPFCRRTQSSYFLSVTNLIKTRAEDPLLKSLMINYNEGWTATWVNSKAFFEINDGDESVRLIPEVIMGYWIEMNCMRRPVTDVMSDEIKKYYDTKFCKAILLESAQKASNEIVSLGKIIDEMTRSVTLREI